MYTVSTFALKIQVFISHTSNAVDNIVTFTINCHLRFLTVK